MGRIRRNLDRFRPISTALNLAKFGRNSAEFGSKSANFQQNWPGRVKFRSGFDQICAGFGRADGPRWIRLVRKWSGICQTRPNTWPEVGQFWRESTTFGTKPKLAQTAEFGPKVANSGQIGASWAARSGMLIERHSETYDEVGRNRREVGGGRICSTSTSPDDRSSLCLCSPPCCPSCFLAGARWPCRADASEGRPNSVKLGRPGGGAER